jgi:TolA-binding protein
MAGFEDAAAMDFHDGARIEHLSAVARQWAQGQAYRTGNVRKRTWHLRILAMAASLLLMVGAASAAMWWRRGRGPEAFAPAPVVEPIARAVVPAMPIPSPASPAIEPAMETRPLRTAGSAQKARVPSAQDLLRQASDTRREGDSKRAILLYRKLQHDFTGTSEASVAAIPLGGLLLDRGFARAALAQFDSYLQSAHGGVLRPEAFYERGRALRLLDDRQEEQRNWERLLVDFADSAYAPLARRRLAELK